MVKMGAKRARGWEFNEEELAKALFGEEFGSLVAGDGDLQWSNSEYQIFSAVFCQTNDLCVNTGGSKGDVCATNGFDSNAYVKSPPHNAGVASANMDGFVVANCVKSATLDQSSVQLVDGDGCCTPGKNFGHSKGKFGVGAELDHYKPTLLIEYSFLPVGLGSRDLKTKQIEPCADFGRVGASSESELLSEKTQVKVGNASVHGSGLVGAFSEKNCGTLISEPEEEFIDSSMHLVAPKVGDDGMKSVGDRKSVHRITGPAAESSVDVRLSDDDPTLKTIASNSTRNDQDCSDSLQSYQRMMAVRDTSNLSTIAKETMDTNFAHLRGKFGDGTELCSTPASLTESSSAPRGLESQDAELLTDAPGCGIVGEPHEKDSRILSLVCQEISENDSVHGSDLVEASSQKVIQQKCGKDSVRASGSVKTSSLNVSVLLSSKHEGKFGNDSGHAAPFKGVDDPMASVFDKEAGQHMTGPVASLSADDMSSHGDPAKKQMALGSGGHEQQCSAESSQEMLAISAASGLDISSPVWATEAMEKNIDGLKGKFGVQIDLHTKLTSRVKCPCLPCALEYQGMKSKQVNLHTDIPGSGKVGASYENGLGIVNSNPQVIFENNSVHGTVLVGASLEIRTGIMSSKPEEKCGDASVHSAPPEVAADATESTDNREVSQCVSKSVAESLLDDILSCDDPSRKQIASDCTGFEQEFPDCLQSYQKMLAVSEALFLDTPSPSDGLAKEAMDAKVVSTSPVSQESSASKIQENNAIVIFEDDMLPLNIYEGHDDKRTREALLLMSEEVKASWKKAFTAELRVKLFQCIKDFLVAAGFEVQFRHRVKKNAIDSVYLSPGNKRVRYTSAIKAWKASAKMLFRGKNKPALDSTIRQWEDMTEFWADLTDALALVESEVQHVGHHIASLKRWVLLDPFVTMLFIERLGPLKGREGAKALMGSTKSSHGCRSSKRLVIKRTSKVPISCDEPSSLGLSLMPQLETDGAHSQLTEAFHIHGSEGLHVALSGERDVQGKDGSITRVQLKSHIPVNMPYRDEVPILVNQCSSQSLKSTGNTSEDVYHNKTGHFTETVWGSSTSRKRRRVLDRKSSVQDAHMQLVEASSYASPDISFDIVPFPHDVGGAYTPPTYNASNFFVVHSVVEGSQMGVVKNAIVASKQKEAQFSILDEGLNQDGKSFERPLVNEKPAQKQVKRCKDVQYLGCRRSPRKKGICIATDDGACQAGSSGHQQDRRLICKDTFYPRSLGELRCDVSESPKFEQLSTLNMSPWRSNELLVIEANKLCNNDVEVDASPAYESRRQFMRPDHESKKIKGVHTSQATKQCKGARKSSAAATFVHQNTSKINSKSQDEFHAVHRQALVLDEEGNIPARASFGDLSANFRGRCKAVKVYKSKANNENGRKNIKDGAVSNKKRCQINDDDLLIAAIIKNKDFSSSKQSPLKGRKSMSRTARKLKSQRGGCKLLPRNLSNGGQHSVDGRQSAFHKRTVLSWMIDCGALFENEVVHYQGPKNGALVKDGWITRDGLLCKCCNNLFSLSEFKIHAGCKIGRLSQNLFVESCESFTLCQLRAWSAEYKTRKGSIHATEIDEVDLNDDTCGICGDGGVLICCDSCPSTFHHACLNNQVLPEDKWYCPYCICKICGDVVLHQDALECSQCECKYHRPCLADGIRCEGDASTTETWFCGESCQKVYSELHSHVGVIHNIGEGFSWTLLRCIHSEPKKVHSMQRLALMAECNTKLAVALTIMEECFVPMIDPRTGIDMIPHVLYNWGSNFARLNYQGFYTMILEWGDEIISVASIRVHGVVVAELPLIATCSGYRRQGMCRRLMNAIEEMLMSIKVERLVISAIPELIDTWMSAFGFKHIDDSDKELFNNINLMVFPGTTLLEKRLHNPQTFERKQTGTRGEMPREGSELPPFEVFPVLESRHQAAASQNAKNDMEIKSVHEVLLLKEKSADLSLLEAGRAVADFSGVVPPACAAPIATDIISDVIDELEACRMQSKPLDHPEGNRAVDMETTVTKFSADDGECSGCAPLDKMFTSLPCDAMDGNIPYSKVKDCSDGMSGQESRISIQGLERYANLQSSTKETKSITKIYHAVDNPRIEETCNCCGLVSKHECCQKFSEFTSSKFAGSDLVGESKKELSILQVDSFDGSLGSPCAPLWCTAEAQIHEIANVRKDHLASVNIVNNDFTTMQKKGFKLPPSEDRTAYEGLHAENGSVEGLVETLLKLSSSGACVTENGDVVEELQAKQVENGDLQIVNLMSVDKELTRSENATQLESFVSSNQVDFSASLDSCSFAPGTEIGIAKVVDLACPTTKSTDVHVKVDVMMSPMETLKENLVAEQVIVNPGHDAINVFQDNSGEESIVRESWVTTVNDDKKSLNLFPHPSTVKPGPCQKANENVDNSSRGMYFNPSCRSAKGKNVPSKSYFLRSMGVGSGTLAEDQNSPSFSKSAKETSPAHKEIILGLGCQPFDDVSLKSSPIKGNGGSTKFHDWL